MSDIEEITFSAADMEKDIQEQIKAGTYWIQNVQFNESEVDSNKPPRWMRRQKKGYSGTSRRPQTRFKLDGFKI